jgi:hypothetical protein
MHATVVHKANRSLKICVPGSWTDAEAFAFVGRNVAYVQGCEWKARLAYVSDHVQRSGCVTNVENVHITYDRIVDTPAVDAPPCHEIRDQAANDETP